MSQPQAYSYIRFSGKRQEKGDSIRRQTAMRDAWLARKGLTLDESLVLPDYAVSAFRGKNLTDGALGWFIKEVEADRVQKGSYLIIERIDRFTRFEPEEALPVFARLIKSGIIIVTLSPEKEWDAESLKGFGIMLLVMELWQSHEESKKKSERLAAKWEFKKKNAATTKVTRRMPTWLRFDDGNIEFVADKKAVVQRIFDLAENGHGTSQIATMLNKEGLPPLFTTTNEDGKVWGTGWHGSSVSKILRSRIVLGEYQPYRITPEGPKRRVPVGEPIRGYYPRVISDTQWHRVQLALDGRRHARGKVGRHVTNLFSNLIHDARDGGGVFLKRIGRSPYFQSRNARRGLSADQFAFSYPDFERAFLQFFHELKISDLSPRKETADDTEENIGRLAEVDRKIEKTKARITSSPDVELLLDIAEQLDKERKELVRAINAARTASSANAQDILEEGASIIDLLDRTKGDELLDMRARLKAIIRSLVKDIWILVEPWGEGKICFAQINFKSGGARMTQILSAGKGVSHLRGKPLELSAGNRQQIPMSGVLDLRNYRKEEVVRKVFASLVNNMQAGTPQAIATKRMLEGEKPYLVAKDLGLANSTCYRWKELARYVSLK